MYLPVKFSYIHESTHATKAKGNFFFNLDGKSCKTNLQWTKKLFRAIFTKRNEFVVGARGKVVAIYHVIGRYLSHGACALSEASYDL